MPKVLIGFLIATAAMAVIYASAATLATSAASGFIPPEATSHTRIAGIATAVRQASSDHRAARAKCKLGAAAKRSDCNSEALTQQRRDLQNARNQ